MARTASQIVFRNVFFRYSPLLNATVQDESEHSTKADAVADILEQELTGYSYSYSLYFGDGQPRRVSLMADVIMLEAERERAEIFTPAPQVGIAHASL
jgi:hypothetical protein